MTTPPALSDKAAKDALKWPDTAEATRHRLVRPAAPQDHADPDRTGEDLVKLVLVLVETVRQLVEKQAIRRVDSGTLSQEEIERLGLALLRLEERMAELKEHFGLRDDDLAFRLGGLGELANEARHG
jgi:hypothetical protein